MPRKPKEKEIEIKDELIDSVSSKKSANSKKTKDSKEITSSKSTVKKSTKSASKKATKSSKEDKESSEKDTKKTATSTEKQAKSTKDTTSKVTSKKTQKTKITSKKEAKSKKEKKAKDSTLSKTSSKSKKAPSSTKTKTTTSKKTNSSKTSSKKSSTTKKASTTKSKTTKRKIEILEYYDLPYRYNQTIVKVLAQTPTTLFVYWDISDSDRENLVNKYGERFFEETKPVLIIHNQTNNYSFEVEINDFANSWYLHISDSKCVYSIELGRKPINQNNESIPQNYIYITSSNKMEAPNDHILFDSLGDTVYFRNVKTNIIEGKKITSLSFIQNIGKIYNIYDIYQKIYPAENVKYFDLNNPSSGNPSSFFK